MQWAQTKIQEIPSEHQETLFHCEGHWTLAQIAQNSGGVFVLGEIQKPSGHGPEEPALGGHAWAGGLDQLTPRGRCQPQLSSDSELWGGLK